MSRRLKSRPPLVVAGGRVKGWRARVNHGFVNPRPPSVPSTMDLRLDEYFAGAAIIGLLASQADEPDHEWACEWAWKMGQKMAQHAVKRRNTRK